MDIEGVEILKIQVKNLEEFASGYQKRANKSGKLVPITLERAISQSKNPEADADDIGLLVAIADQQCVGYLGLVPGKYFSAGGEFNKVLWLSTWYVTPGFRKTMLGPALITKAQELGMLLCSTGINPNTYGIYKKLGFKELPALKYQRINYSKLSLSKILINRLPGIKFGKINWVTNLLGRISRAMYTPFRYILLWATYLERYYFIKQFDYVEVKLVGGDQFGNGLTFPRFVETVNWMINYPWIIEGKPKLSNDYAFSHTRTLFKYIPVNIYNRRTQEIIGYVVFAITQKGKDKVLKTLDISIKKPSYEKVIRYIETILAIRHRVDLIETHCFNSDGKNSAYIWKFLSSEDLRVYYIYNPNPEIQEQPEMRNARLNYCDGDTAFT